jgi:signal transduction histidine kinase
MFDRVLARRPLLPDESLVGQSNDSLLALVVRDRHGHVLWRNGIGAGVATDYEATASLARLGGITVQAALRPTAVERLAAEPVPRMRLGVLVALLVVTTGLAVVALVQLRREQDLARLRADFTSSVSHELRTPLAQIMLFGETLALDRFRDAADRRLAAGTIVSEARRLMHMVDNVLHFAHAERGLTTVTPHAEALAPLVRDVVRAFGPLAEGVRFRLELAEDVTVMGDAAALRQVLINLLDNAVKYGPPEQVVTVGVDVQPGAPAFGGGEARARLWVDDEGTGVPAESRGRVFEPYVRLVRHQGAARGGSGIGLSVVRELVTLHGGATWVEPAPAGGARFVVTLPLVEPARLARTASPSLGGPPQEQDGPDGASLHHPDHAVRSTSAPGAGAHPPSGATA